MLARASRITVSLRQLGHPGAHGAGRSRGLTTLPSVECLFWLEKGPSPNVRNGSKADAWLPPRRLDYRRPKSNEIPRWSPAAQATWPNSERSPTFSSMPAPSSGRPKPAQPRPGQREIFDQNGRRPVPKDRGCRGADPFAPEPPAAAGPIRALTETSQIRTPSSPDQSARSSPPLNRGLGCCSIAGQARQPPLPGREGLGVGARSAPCYAGQMSRRVETAITKRARALRTNATREERIIWGLLSQYRPRFTRAADRWLH